MHHCLYIDADNVYINVAGVYHNYKARKKGESYHISHYRVAEFAVLCENEYGQKIDGRGAELEGEYVPLIAPFSRYTVAVHRENYLLVHLEKDYYYPENKENSAERFIAAILEFPNHKSGECNCKRERNDMPRAEKRGPFHCCAENVYHFFKKIHKITSLK